MSYYYLTITALITAALTFKSKPQFLKNPLPLEVLSSALSTVKSVQFLPLSLIDIVILTPITKDKCQISKRWVSNHMSLMPSNLSFTQSVYPVLKVRINFGGVQLHSTVPLKQKYTLYLPVCMFRKVNLDVYSFTEV